MTEPLNFPLKKNIQFLKYYFNKFLGHLGSPHRRSDPEAVINSEATTNIAAIENKNELNIEEFLFIGEPPFLLIVGVPADRLSIYRTQKNFCYM